MQFTNGNSINYMYDAAGRKLSVTHRTAVAGITLPMTNVMTPLAPNNVAATTTTDYCGNVIYENGAVSMVLTEEGYITNVATSPTYHYYLKDHQGNNRVVIDQYDSVKQVNHYYPFGGLFGDNTGGDAQPYKYNGKELDRMHGLDLFDYGARHYDAAIGRWGTVDPLAEKYYSISPYVYCADNPVRFVDPYGEDVWQIDAEGRIIKRIEDTTQDAFHFGSVDADGNFQQKQVRGEDGEMVGVGISFKYGTIESQRSISFSPDRIKKDTYDVYQVRGDDNGTKLFNFMSGHVKGSPTQVEIGQAKTGVAGERGLNFITTSHQKRQEAGMSYLLAGQLYYGYTIRELNHSHPVNSYASNDDNRFARDVTTTLSGQGLRVPIFNIWYVPSKTLIQYGR